MGALSNLLIPAVLFFALGFFARVVKSDLRFPQDMAKMLSIYLLVAIGLHGGYELGRADLGVALQAVVWALVMGFTLPIIGYLLLVVTRRVSPLDAAAVAAHYGSVSAGTFLAAVAYLDSAGIEYESYPVIMLAVMESPAIIVGLLLAAWTRRRMGRNGSAEPAPADPVGQGGMSSLLHEALTNGSVLLLLGSLLIGAIAAPGSMDSLFPFINEIFMGVLCLFLLEMGMEAARRIREFRKVGVIMVAFGLVMPLIGGVVGVAIGHWALGFGLGGTTLVAVLGASASYIAVPPAMRLAVPEANPSLYLTLALGITFPFNVIIGIPLYLYLARLVGAA
ncbi:sodium-dependent bicarbonate transport family permease [Thioalkalivibrio paradoxus]|uniref:Permease n=1 Tax=Thioalkalivibrio paradoxus ARh 1 TaxID=713585 RepID=W0DPI2_9GAMM|nr:sodium-dependent bicarbonate transport family permease [Thioalkalivibrio paradoxus]AHE98913.1 hypothetical protein THITH_12315 [Thioalkalivibrio paradoxus ARh 1]